MDERNLLGRLFSPALRGIFGGKSTLSSFVFHGLLKDRDEVKEAPIYPHQPMTVKDLREFVEFHLEKGYTFVSPEEIYIGSRVPGKYALITFDDGYYNNVRALDVLKEFRITAAFFPTMKNIEDGRAFWWDTIWRNRFREGADRKSIKSEIRSMETKTKEGIENHLKKAFGDRALYPAGDIDRPFTQNELKKFSAEKFVHIGNHTMDHVPLINCSPEEIKYQVTTAQAKLATLTGKEPLMISYPHGKYSEEVIRISQDAELKLGITVNDGREPLPLKDPFRMKRYSSLKGDGDIKQQCAELEKGRY